jgi:hypothetical protein
VGCGRIARRRALDRPSGTELSAARLHALAGLSFEAGLACFGDSPLTAEGSFERCLGSTPAIIAPHWLGSAACSLRPLGTTPDAQFAGPRVVFHVPDDTHPWQPSALRRAPPSESLVTSTILRHRPAMPGRCLVQNRLPGRPQKRPLAQGVVVGCRASFVVTEAALLGQ